MASDLASHHFDLKETGKRIRDAARASALPVSRTDVNWVLRGLLLQGHPFGAGADDAQTLSRKTAQNIRSLCLREQIVLDEETEAAIERWIAPEPWSTTRPHVADRPD